MLIKPDRPMINVQIYIISKTAKRKALRVGMENILP